MPESLPLRRPPVRAGKRRQDAKVQLLSGPLEPGKLPTCRGLPGESLDAGPLEELEKKYGKTREAEGFKYSKRTKPAVIFKPKRYSQDR